MNPKSIVIQAGHWKFNVLYKRKPYKVFRGGRGGMKSWECAKALIYYLKKYPGLFAVVCRETEVSLEHSAKKLVWDTLGRLGLQSEFESIQGCIRHKSNGSFVIFKGIGKDPDSIKSMEGADIVWVEEAQTISQRSLEILTPTINRKSGAEMWFTFNPRFRTDAVSVMFDGGHPLAEIQTINYTENPFLSPEFLAEANEMQRKNPKLYEHIYLGAYVDDSALVMVPNVVFGVAPVYDNDIVIVGVDIARDGDDALEICVRKGCNIVETQSHHNMDLDKLSAQLIDINRRFKPERINIDSTGHGAWCADGLRKSGFTNIYPINFAESAWDEDLYANKRTNLYALAKKYFDNGGVVPVGSIDLEKQLLTARYTFDTKNRAQLIPKKEMKVILGCSPDKSDAFCLSLYTTGDMFRKQTTIRNPQQNITRSILALAEA